MSDVTLDSLETPPNTSVGANNMDKELARTVWIEGYKLGKSVEEVQDASIAAAEAEFEEWWRKNIEDGVHANYGDSDAVPE